MHLPDVASSPAAATSVRAVAGVMLLGVRVTAYAVINVAEHRRREAAGMGAVLQPALLDRLLDQPTGVPVIDPAGWAEMAGQPAGILERDEAAAPDAAPDPVVLRWWKMMEPYMECNPDGSPRQEPVEEMFHAR